MANHHHDGEATRCPGSLHDSSSPRGEANGRTWSSLVAASLAAIEQRQALYAAQLAVLASDAGWLMQRPAVRRV